MTTINYNKEITIDVLSIQKDTVKLEYEDESAESIEFVAEVQLKVSHNNTEYYVECYCLDVEESDNYVIRVYDDKRGINSNTDKYQITMSDVDSSGTIYDEGLQLEDKDVEKAIMKVLFTGDKPLVTPFCINKS